MYAILRIVISWIFLNFTGPKRGGGNRGQFNSSLYVFQPEDYLVTNYLMWNWTLEERKPLRQIKVS